MSSGFRNHKCKDLGVHGLWSTCRVCKTLRGRRNLNKFANLEFRLEALPNSRRSQTESYDYEGIPQEILSRNIVTGNNVQDAQQAYDPETGQPQVNIQLDNDGGRRMNAIARITSADRWQSFIEQKPSSQEKR